MFLDDEQLQRLTHRTRPAAQRRVLIAMGIEHKLRPDGSLAVLTSHIERTFDSGLASAKIDKEQEPNWELI